MFFTIVSSEVTFIHDVPLQSHSTPINQRLNLETSCNAINNVSSIEVDVPQPHCSSGNSTYFLIIYHNILYIIIYHYILYILYCFVNPTNKLNYIL